MKRTSALLARNALANDLRLSSASLFARRAILQSGPSAIFRSTSKTSSRSYSGAASEIIDACKLELNEIQEERTDRLKFVTEYLNKLKYTVEKTDDLESVKIVKRDMNKNEEITITMRPAEKKEEDTEEGEEKEEKEQNDFSLEIKRGGSVLRFDGWTEGDTYDIDKVVVGSFERFMEEDGDEEVARFKAYLSEVAGLKEPDFPHAVADLLELNALDKDQKWNEELSRFVKD